MSESELHDLITLRPRDLEARFPGRTKSELMALRQKRQQLLAHRRHREMKRRNGDTSVADDDRLWRKSATLASRQYTDAILRLAGRGA